ncbi:MAG: phosphoglycerate kinase [Candidatus Moranbacteria bacterium CG_4_9_14_3_um_filter_42_9]|nr:MAG: phosphoglycerate kinase [Candidatus Moranbacteria bacterium CG_4_9_14_3_um_filter_42_9]
MELKKIQDVSDLENKKILLRVDFNVAVKNDEVLESYKINAARDTLKYLLNKDAKVALVSHLGRPDGKKDPAFSLEQIAKSVGKILGEKVIYFNDCIGKKVTVMLENLRYGEVLLLENIRFYPEEEQNDPAFALNMAKNFDLYVNDAFSVCHRDQASVTGVAKLLPSYAGFWLQKEIENLDKIKIDPLHPAVAIIGGAKIETKLPVINILEKNYDFVLVGGKIAAEAQEQKIKFSSKVVLAEDFAKDGLDIGPKAVEKYKKIISHAKTIIWNGPMGKFEEKPYDFGTLEILRAVIESPAYTLVGGGESVQVLEENNAMDKISFVSTGGGAMLEYLSGNKLPGIEVLYDK